MTFAEMILAVMLTMKTYGGDLKDTPEQRSELYRPVADAIAAVAEGNKTVAAGLLSLSYHETNWARYVLEGRCTDGPKGARCDQNSKTKKPQARGPWQVWSWCTEAWGAVDGSPEEKLGGARCAKKHLLGSLKRCKGRNSAGDWPGAFSGYRGLDCTWWRGRQRTVTMSLFFGRLRKIVDQDAKTGGAP